MEILLQGSGIESSLKSFYEQAIAEAKELFIVTAFLTHWEYPKVGKKCDELLFIAGKNFNYTIPIACRKVLRWLPKKHKGSFYIAEFEGFHPKLVLWKSQTGKFNLIIGSSNLSEAGASSNHEANIFVPITSKEYNRIRNWIYSITEKCRAINPDWIKGYEKEYERTKTKKKSVPPAQILTLPVLDIELLKYRRKQLSAFKKIKDEFIQLIQECAEKRISNKNFYSRMMSLWGSHKSRIQSPGWERATSKCNWRQSCSSLAKIFAEDKNLHKQDHMIRKELDFLEVKKNPSRKAWLTELMCQFYPSRYPVLNNPVKDWLASQDYRIPPGSSLGAKYLYIAKELRRALRQQDSSGINKIKNLAELDILIWHLMTD